MSETNDWLEHMSDAFSSAVDKGGIEEARKIIAQVKEVSPKDAATLEGELLDTPVFEFIAGWAAAH